MNNTTITPSSGQCVTVPTCLTFLGERLGTTRFNKSHLDAATWLHTLISFEIHPVILRKGGYWHHLSRRKWCESLSFSDDRLDRSLTVLKGANVVDTGGRKWVGARLGSFHLALVDGVREEVLSLPFPAPLQAKIDFAYKAGAFYANAS